MKMRKTAIGAACAALATSAMAQQTGSTPDTTLRTVTVTVTANKVEEKLKDVPQAVTLITGEAIKEQGIRNIGDLVREIPNLSSNFLYANEVNFRGINMSIFTTSNPVVIYIDGIPQSNIYAYEALLENVDRVEVLRGPQGTLYGKDAIGGVINVITKTPTNIWGGQVGVEAANQGGRDLTFSANGPLAKDQLFVTFSGKVAEKDGWITNHFPGANPDANRADEQRFNLGLFYKASPRTQFRFHASHDEQNNYGANGGLVPFGGDYRSLSRDDAKRANFDQETASKTKADAQSLAVQHKFGGVTLDAIATNKSIKMTGDYDVDWRSGNPLYDGLNQFQHLTNDTQTQEIRLSGGAQGRTRWITGLYFEQDKKRHTRYGIQVPGALMGMPGVNLDMDAPSTTKGTTQAVFGQIMVPMVKDLELTLGGRYQRIEKEFDVAMTMQPTGTTGAPPVMAIDDASHSWSTFLPKVALSYDINSRWKSYASVARGYLPGGYNHWPSSSVEKDNLFGPQTSTNYEAGLRSDFGRLYLSASLFLMDIKDIHVYSYDRTTSMIMASNGGTGTSKGAELEASYLIDGHWELSGALGLARATYDDYAALTTSGGVVNSGNKIEKTPAYTARIGLQYTAGNGFYARGDVRGQGKRYFNPENTFEDGAYTTVDVKAGYKTGPWDFYGYVRNLADTEYRTMVNYQSSGSLVTFGEPRRLGLGARYSF
jgi:iron complex outermembrane receptor protein